MLESIAADIAKRSPAPRRPAIYHSGPNFYLNVDSQEASQRIMQVLFRSQEPKKFVQELCMVSVESMEDQALYQQKKLFVEIIRERLLETLLVPGPGLSKKQKKKEKKKQKQLKKQRLAQQASNA